MAKPDKETLIKQYMEINNKTREEAEFMAAIELGEIEGDVIDLEGEDAASED